MNISKKSQHIPSLNSFIHLTFHSINQQPTTFQGTDLVLTWCNDRPSTNLAQNGVDNVVEVTRLARVRIADDMCGAWIFIQKFWLVHVTSNGVDSSTIDQIGGRSFGWWWWWVEWRLRDGGTEEGSGLVEIDPKHARKVWMLALILCNLCV